MTELQQNRYDRLLRRVGGLIGPGSMVNDALGELFPMIDVESLNAELAFLADWRLAVASLSHAASVGDQNHVQLFNPADSGVLVVLERVDLQTSADQFFRYVTTATALANFTANQGLRDTRGGVTTTPVAQLRDVQISAGVSREGQIFVRADVNEVLEEKKGLYVLAPGTGVEFVTTVVNLDTTMSFLWRERAAEPSELAF